MANHFHLKRSEGSAESVRISTSTADTAAADFSVMIDTAMDDDSGEITYSSMEPDLEVLQIGKIKLSKKACGSELCLRSFGPRQ
jgi:hypothetical protein